jgi:hypothetical protein
MEYCMKVNEHPILPIYKNEELVAL